MDLQSCDWLVVNDHDAHLNPCVQRFRGVEPGKIRPPPQKHSDSNTADTMIIVTRLSLMKCLLLNQSCPILTWMSIHLPSPASHQPNANGKEQLNKHL